MNKFIKESKKNFSNGTLDDVIENNYSIAKSQFTALESLAKVEAEMLKSRLKTAKTKFSKSLFPGYEIKNADEYAKTVLEAKKEVISIEEEIKAIEKTQKFYEEVIAAITEE